MAIKNESLIDAYKKMVYLRVTEEELAAYYLKNKIMSFVHFYVGQEAVAVGVCDALGKDDKVMGNHRSHGHYLARGGDLKKMVCELLGKEPGSSRGKGGSMHMIDKSVGFVGSTPILGSVVPLACGVAFEKKYNKQSGVAVVFCGDGASEEGIVYETYNLAALFNLPLLIVIENNLYSVNSKLDERRSSKYDTEKIVTGLGVKYAQADGKDYEDVLSKASALVAGIRAGEGPAVLECKTHRHMAHSAPIFDDAQGYRVEDVPEKRLEADAIRKVKKVLLAEGMSDEECAAIEKDARDRALEAIEFAVNAKYPPKENLYTNLYA